MRLFHKGHICVQPRIIFLHLNMSKQKSLLLESKAWVAAEAFVGPGVTIGEGAVVGARAAVFKNVTPWTVVGGNPAKYIKDRVIKD